LLFSGLDYSEDFLAMRFVWLG